MAEPSSQMQLYSCAARLRDYMAEQEHPLFDSLQSMAKNNGEEELAARVSSHLHAVKRAAQDFSGQRKDTGETCDVFRKALPLVMRAICVSQPLDFPSHLRGEAEECMRNVRNETGARLYLKSLRNSQELNRDMDLGPLVPVAEQLFEFCDMVPQRQATR